MKDRIRERLKNQGVAFTRHAAKVHLERAGLTLSDEWTRHRTEESAKSTAADRLLEPTIDEAQALEELKALLVSRIEEGLTGTVSNTRIEEIVQSELQ